MTIFHSTIGQFAWGSLVFFSAGLGLAVIQTASAGDLAIKGYDPVAYFTAGKAQKGSTSFTHVWHGMTWLFLSLENRDLFSTDPEKYSPQYDGFCAWALTEDRLAVTDPEVWQIVDAKLYLQCSDVAMEKWRKDIPGNIRKADLNWQKMQREK